MRVHFEGGSQEKRSMSDELNPFLEEPEVKDLYEACRLFRSVVRKWRDRERKLYEGSTFKPYIRIHTIKAVAYSNVLLQFERHVQPFMIREICLRRDQDELPESNGKRKSERANEASYTTKDRMDGRTDGGRRICGPYGVKGKKAEG